MNKQEEIKLRLAQYADLKRAEKQLKADIGVLKPIILDYMNEDATKELEAEVGTFTIQSRRTWKYSDDVDQVESNLKEKKKIEQQEGTATYEEKDSLYFKAAE